MDININSLEKTAGEGVNISENPKTIKKRDKQFFVNLVNTLSDLEDRSTYLMDLGIDMIRYEDPYFSIIENLIIRSYVSLKGGIILWWCGERKLLDAKSYNMIDENGNSTVISNVNQLYNYLNKIK
jgi:hypothetical protein